ncbi:MAG: hypothetical protein LBJ72_08440, partial [Dysgonamonadaceae bacterium]|nr:hypothetical protein [Dysgonamonadaceae bacterium]
MKQLILILFQLVFMAGIPLIGQTNLTVNNAGELESSVNSASGDVVITFASGFVSGNVNITQPNVNVTVDGGNFIWSTGVIKVSGSGTGTLIVKNLKMDGATATQRLFAGSGSNGKLILKRMEFYNSKHGAIDISTSGNASTVISYTKIYDNTAANSASAVWVGASTNLVINNSTIENNIGTGAGYQCGAIASNFHTGTLEINNTIFRNNVNKCVFSGIFGGGGGAMSLHYLKGSVTINRSLFQGNKTNGEGISVAKTYDGGAIYVFDGRDGAKININNTTFDGNLAYDDGGALMIQGTGKPGLTTTITNCTFYKNIGYGLDGGNVSGGAIQFFKNGGSSVMSNTILGCTFVGNESGTQSSTVSQQGGAIALSGAGTFATASVTYNATLFIGNKVYDSTGQLNTASNYKDISNNTGEQLGARNIINADKGSAPKYTAEDILGESYGLRENLSGIVAGVNDEILKTLPIKPEGIADNTYNGSVTLPATDQRDFGRNKDQGAVEMVWVRFDANGGTWTGLDDNFAYDGLDYYKSTATKASIHYKVSYTGGKVNLPSETLISPVAGQTPKWVIDDGDSDDTNDVEWDPAKTIQENTKVKAVWKSALLKVTYDPNGGKGTAQTVNCAADNTHTILDYRNALLNFTPPIELVFLGWNTLANGSGTMYTVNSVATFTTDTILYAQWIDILEIEGISDVCSDETEMHIPVHIKYAGLPTMEYVMYFCDEAKDVGFVDKTEFSELPHEYIRIKMPERVLSGEYDVEVYIRYKSGTDTVLKTSFEMEITEAIKITRQPVSTAGCEGGNFNLSVEATDNGPDYQWYHDDRKIENATSDSYKGVISSGTAGSYYVELTGFCGTVVSDKVSVTKTEGTQIIRQPVSVTAGCEGGSFDLSVEATGDNLTYQWYHDDRKIENATSDRYEGVISSGTAGSYHVEITGTCGTVTSDKASVTKTEETQITRQPVSVATGCEGGSFNFSVEATGDNL